MAADWIKMRGNLWDDPRVSRLVDMTDTSEAAVVGGLYWLWAAADQHTADGMMPGLSLRQIDRKTGIAGLGEALVSIGWIKECPEGVCLANFEEHNGSSAKRRVSESRRKMSARDADELRTECGQSAHLEKEREKEKEQKIPASADTDPSPGAKPKKQPSGKIGLDAFLAACSEAGEDPITAEDAVWTYAERAGLPDEFVGLAWVWFKRRYAEKRQAGVRGWRQTFRNAVEGNWPKLWYVDDTNTYRLTTAGRQAQMEASR